VLGNDDPIKTPNPPPLIGNAEKKTGLNSLKKTLRLI
jgi:hypothetical protein